MDKIEEMFKNIDILEDFYNKGFINIEEYYKIKSNIIDFYKKYKENKDDGDLPF